MADFHFLRPYWLLMLIPTLMIWLGFLRRRDEHKKLKNVIDEHLLEHLMISPDGRIRIRPVHVLAVVLMLSAVALAGPSFRSQPSPFIDDEAGLMILLKVAPSMNSEDVQPSRLARAKQKIRDLIETRKGSATGLIAYSGSAHLVMPLTKDGRVITTMIEDLTPELMPKEGDALEDAVALAEQFLQQTGQPGSLLVMADTVSAGTGSLQKKTRLPVQFLSLLPYGSPVDPSMQQVASLLGASVTRLTADSSDVEDLARRTRSSLAAVSDSEERQQREDDGYWLLPLLTLLSLLWFRKGWVVR